MKFSNLIIKRNESRVIFPFYLYPQVVENHRSSLLVVQKDSRYLSKNYRNERNVLVRWRRNARVRSKFTRNAAKLVDASLKCTRAPHARTPPTSFACKLFARASNGRRARQPKCNMCSSFCRPVPRTFESLHKVAKLPLKLCARYLDGICQM